MRQIESPVSAAEMIRLATRKLTRANGDAAVGSQSVASSSQTGLLNCSTEGSGPMPRSISADTSSASSQIANTVYVAISASCGLDAQTEKVSDRQTPTTDTPTMTIVPVRMSTGSTPPSEVRMASTGRPQAITPSTVTSREASRPSTISASDKSVTIIRVSPPRNLSWQIAPAVTAGTIARASVSSSPMMARTKVAPAAANCWREWNSVPRYRLSQTITITTSTLPTSIARPA